MNRTYEDSSSPILGVLEQNSALYNTNFGHFLPFWRAQRVLNFLALHYFANFAVKVNDRVFHYNNIKLTINNQQNISEHEKINARDADTGPGRTGSHDSRQSGYDCNAKRRKHTGL